MTEDLDVWVRAREDQKARLAAVLSIAAIVLLLIVSAWLARNPMGAAQGSESLRTIGKDSSARGIVADYPASAPTLDCLRLRKGQWLRVIVHHKGDGKGLLYGGERLECHYGHAPSERYVQ